MSALRLIWPAWLALCVAWLFVASDAWERAVTAVCIIVAGYATAYVWNLGGWWS